MDETKKTISGGLLPHVEDKRDYSHSTVFGSLTDDELESLPDDYFVGHPLRIKDQGSSDFCAGFAAAAVREDTENIELNPLYTWAQAKKLIGPEAWRQWGMSLRDICKAAVKIGFIEEEHNIFQGKEDATRDFLAQADNWPEDLKMLAWDHAAVSYFVVDGPHDTFDNLRMTMWINRKERRSVLTGASWRQSWTDRVGGIIGDQYEINGIGHAFKVFGWMNIRSKTYLVAQLSNGDTIGDKGLFYFPREVVNKEFVYGAFTFKDMPSEYAAWHNENGLNVKDNPIKKLIKTLLNFILSFFKLA